MSREKKKGGHRSAKDLRRKKPVSDEKSILIVTEGEVTEKNYFTALKNKLKLSNSEIVVKHPRVTDPIKLVYEAKRLQKKRELEAKRSNKLIPYTEVWVVFDLEQQHDIRRQQAKKAHEHTKGIQFIESDPSFELWRLLHEKKTSKFFADKEAVIAEISRTIGKKYNPNETPSEETLKKIPDAVANALWLRNDNKKSGSTTPSTNVDHLVRSMNKAARPSSQLELPVKN